mmetsp:Transcript_20982/g.53005  ORF Transcript_20982/g.53005 Transcript_20982/m.53005 type:complete len:173 (-) Transcript_20982:356-874(-)|eukprot:CAMPEP_0178997064 /NCGR_PEP_ID=MMETSP0795-20121207/8725_1 /TAXON_ID=88552 /ORGANISM="Amoebophrya sp., Strain Ameob2" /LENGTH=172 /DNA_ID=CAMNT_0020689541 /DNA_START=136 /DNA_END=654 /DNA_ORIENTATION=+
MPVDLSISTKMAANALDLAQAAQWAVKPLKEDATNMAIRINLAAEKIQKLAKNLEKFVYTVPVPHFPTALPTMPKAGMVTYTTPPPAGVATKAGDLDLSGTPSVEDFLKRAKNVNSFLEIGVEPMVAPKTAFLRIGLGGQDMAEQVYMQGFLRNPAPDAYFEPAPDKPPDEG